MKFSKVLLLISIAIFTILSSAYSQKNDSLVIRDLEEDERTAILKGDTVRLGERKRHLEINCPPGYNYFTKMKGNCG